MTASALQGSSTAAELTASTSELTGLLESTARRQGSVFGCLLSNLLISKVHFLPLDIKSPSGAANSASETKNKNRRVYKHCSLRKISDEICVLVSREKEHEVLLWELRWVVRVLKRIELT